MQESEPSELYEEVTQPQETTQEEVHLVGQHSQCFSLDVSSLC